MRADRLLTILLLLQSQGRLTSRQLAEKLEVSERTIFRDMEALGAAGVPVYAERGAGGGWRLTDGYKTELTGLRKEELVSLLLSSPGALLSDLNMKQSFESAWIKLLASLPSALRKDAEFARERLHVDGAGWYESGETYPLLPVVQEAVWAGRKLRIRYRKEDGAISERIVHPLGLVVKSGTWYVAAVYEEELRSFRISRMAEAAVLEEPAERPPGVDLASYWTKSTAEFKSSLPSYIVRMTIKPALLPRLRQSRFVKIRSCVQIGDGCLEVTADLQSPDFACEYITSLGSDAEALDPPELRVMIVRHAKMLLERYGGGIAR